jgi:hypothetical protein
MKYLGVALLAFAALTAHADERPLSDAQIRKHLIEASIDDYLANHGNCPCPYNRMRNGRKCGKRSAWSKPNGEAPLCYDDDVTAGMIEAYRAEQRRD